MRRDLTTSAIAVVVLTILLGLAYPLAMTGISEALFPSQSDGSRVKAGGHVVGSRLIGQSFADVVLGPGAKPKLDSNGNPLTAPDRRYFQTRPSATVPADNAAGTAFSNLGPNSVATRQALSANLGAYLALERPYVPGLTAGRVPVDAVDNSASGIDPDISLANARIQAHRIAAERHMSLPSVLRLVAHYVDGRSLGFFGEPGVNVLELNLALDRAGGAR